MRIEHSQVVKGPREQVFQTWTDYEAWPWFGILFPHVKVTERVGHTVDLDAPARSRPQVAELRGRQAGGSSATRAIWR